MLLCGLSWSFHFGHIVDSERPTSEIPLQPFYESMALNMATTDHFSFDIARFNSNTLIDINQFDTMKVGIAGITGKFARHLVTSPLKRQHSHD